MFRKRQLAPLLLVKYIIEMELCPIMLVKYISEKALSPIPLVKYISEKTLSPILLVYIHQKQKQVKRQLQIFYKTKLPKA